MNRPEHMQTASVDLPTGRSPSVSCKVPRKVPASAPLCAREIPRSYCPRSPVRISAQRPPTALQGTASRLDIRCVRLLTHATKG